MASREALADGLQAEVAVSRGVFVTRRLISFLRDVAVLVLDTGD